MKAVLTNRIYMNTTPELTEELRELLTHHFPPTSPQGKPTKSCDVFTINRNIVSIPAGRVDLIPKDYEIVDKRLIIPAKIPELDITLREEQQDIYDKVNSNCLINAKPAWGKTFTALAITQKLQQKTLVVVHSVMLREQWEEECRKLKIPYGIIGSQKFDTTKPITIANVQTLAKRLDDIADKFGLVIMDECHHTPATTFKSVIDKLKCKYKIGLSATLKRKDRKHVLIPDYFGSKVYVATDNNSLIPEIHTIQLDIAVDSNPMVPWSKKMNQLMKNEHYRESILHIAKAYQQKGRKVLVVANRTEFLDWLTNRMDNAVCIIGSTGDRKNLLDKVREGEYNIINGSIEIFKEGMSINNLDCLILATPVNNDPLLEQLIGRVTRKHENKPLPIIVDIVLKGKTATNQANNRLGYYIGQGYNIRSL